MGFNETKVEFSKTKLVREVKGLISTGTQPVKKKFTSAIIDLADLTKNVTNRHKYNDRSGQNSTYWNTN